MEKAYTALRGVHPYRDLTTDPQGCDCVVVDYPLFACIENCRQT